MERKGIFESSGHVKNTEDFEGSKDETNQRKAFSFDDASMKRSSPFAACYGRQPWKKIIICQYPKVQSESTQMPKESEFFRVDYLDAAKKKNNGYQPLKSLALGMGDSQVPVKPERAYIPKALRGGQIISGGLKIPIVQLGLRCDSPEFIEQQVRASSWKRGEIVSRPNEKDFIGGLHKDFIGLPPGKKRLSAKSNNPKGITMTRFDYKKTSDGPVSCRPLANSSSTHQPSCSGAETEIGETDSAKNDENSDQGSDYLGERLILESSSDEEDNADPSLDESTDHAPITVVNLPFAIMIRRPPEENSTILDGERLVELYADMSNTSQIWCSVCGSKFDGLKLLKLMYYSK